MKKSIRSPICLLSFSTLKTWSACVLPPYLIGESDLSTMREQTVAISSGGKTFSFTGWKVGWGMGVVVGVMLAKVLDCLDMPAEQDEGAEV